MIRFEENSQGIVLSVKAQPGARRNGINGIHAGAIKVSVTQAPEKGKANDAILQLLADRLELKRNQIHLASGQTSPLKKFLITGITLAELEQRVQQLHDP